VAHSPTQSLLEADLVHAVVTDTTAASSSVLKAGDSAFASEGIPALPINRANEWKPAKVLRTFDKQDAQFTEHDCLEIHAGMVVEVAAKDFYAGWYYCRRSQGCDAAMGYIPCDAVL